MIVPERPAGPAAVGQHYDALDFFYRDCWGEHLHHGLWVRGDESAAEATRALVVEAVAPLGLRAGQRVVDIGCGYGATARLLVAGFAVRVTGFTLSRAQHGAASGPGIDVRLGDWLENDLGDGSVDAALSIECLAHVADKRRFFCEIARVLRPGGRASVLCWTAGETADARLVASICRGGQLAGIGSADEYREIIARAGLTLVAENDLTRNVSRTWRVIVGRLLVRSVTRSGYLGRLAVAPGRHLRLGWTVLQVMRAYRNRSLGYGMFVMERARG